MIVTEETPQSPAKDSDSTPLLGGGGPSGSGAPPAYAPRDSGPTPIAAPQAPYVVHQPVYHQRQVGGQSAAGRFCRAFLVAFGIWILLSALVGSIADTGVRIQALNYSGYPTPPGVDVHHCKTQWPTAEKKTMFGSFPYSVDLDFNFPLPSETLLLLSEGSLSAGNLKITSAYDLTDQVRVHVTVHYYGTAVRDTAKICLIKRENGESGLGIFTPKNWYSRKRTDRLYFDVELILPHTLSSPSPLYINALSTDLNNFSQDVAALINIIKFGELSLRGSNGKIHAASLAADNATVTTSNGAVMIDHLTALTAAVRSSNGNIGGDYHVVDSLDLITSNGIIKVAATINAGDSKDTKSLTMHTTNSVLDSTVTYTTSSGTGGALRVDAKTTNGGLNTQIASIPLDAVLNLKATTSNSRATLGLPVTYEGDLAVYTSNSVPSIVFDAYKQDPAHKGRGRGQETTMVRRGAATGNVYWDKANIHRGSVVVKTTNGAAAIHL
ncbi:hypothetical protein C8R43DRAFT_956583 [Mycena crocata]|nr:hypothetical protein C8R43DRAFT_956583 [Mycena crocata]